MNKSDFIKKSEDFVGEIMSDCDKLEDVKSFQDCCEVSQFCYDIKQRVQSLKELLG